MLTSTCVLLVVADNEAYVDRHFVAGRFLHRAGANFKGTSRDDSAKKIGVNMSNI